MNARAPQPSSTRLTRFLYGVCNVTRWVVGLVALTIPVRLLLADRVPLTLGGDPNDLDSDQPSVQIGVVVEAGMSQAALIAHNIVAMIVSLAVVLLLTELMGVLRNVINGDAFVRENGDRLRRIGWIGAAAQLSLYGVWAGASLLAVMSDLEVRNLPMQFSPLPWIGVLAAFALATVFQDAATLKSEQDLTV